MTSKPAVEIYSQKWENINLYSTISISKNIAPTSVVLGDENLEVGLISIGLDMTGRPQLLLGGDKVTWRGLAFLKLMVKSFRSPKTPPPPQ